jgi:hypothetical protein
MCPITRTVLTNGYDRAPTLAHTQTHALCHGQGPHVCVGRQGPLRGAATERVGGHDGRGHQRHPQGKRVQVPTLETGPPSSPRCAPPPCRTWWIHSRAQRSPRTTLSRSSAAARALPEPGSTSSRPSTRRRCRRRSVRVLCPHLPACTDSLAPGAAAQNWATTRDKPKRGVRSRSPTAASADTMSVHAGLGPAVCTAHKAATVPSVPTLALTSDRRVVCLPPHQRRERYGFPQTQERCGERRTRTHTHTCHMPPRVRTERSADDDGASATWPPSASSRRCHSVW